MTGHTWGTLGIVSLFLVMAYFQIKITRDSGWHWLFAFATAAWYVGLILLVTWRQ